MYTQNSDMNFVNEFYIESWNDRCWQYDRIYLRYRDYVRFLIRSRIKKNCDVDDLVQDVFLKLWEYRKKIDETKSVKNLLYTVTINTVFNYNNHEAVINKFKSFASTGRLVFDFNTTESEIFVNEIKAEVEDILNACPTRQKEVFNLFWEQGMSRQQIAQKEGISLRTVENQIYRARRKLKMELVELAG